MTDSKDNKGGGISIHSDLSLDENASAPDTEIATGPIAVDLPPWRIILASELTPGKNASGPYEVDKNRFAALLQELSPSLSLTVVCHLETGEEHLDVDLVFSSMKGFHPDNLARQVPALQTLCRLRVLVQEQGATALSQLPALYNGQPVPKALATLAVDDATDESRPQQKPATSLQETKGGKKEALDAIFDVLGDTEQNDIPPEEDPIGALIDAVGKNAGSAPKRTGAGRITETIDHLLSHQMDAICHHPSFLRLEAAWRECKFLVDRIDFRENIRLDVTSSAKDTLREFLVESVFRPAWNNERPAPDVLIIAHELGHGPVDTELLGDLARLGESTQTPVSACAGPSFYDQEHFADLSSVPSLAELLAGPGYEKWRAIRELDESSYLVLCTNAFLLREPFNPKGWRTKAFDYTEGGGGKALPWGAASVAICTILTESFPQLESNRAELADLPILGAGGLPGREEAATCAGYFSKSRLADLAGAGLCPLGCHASQTGLFAPALQTAMKNGPSIPEAVLAGHLSRIALVAAQKYADKNDGGKITSAVTAAIVRLLLPEGEKPPEQMVQVETGPHPEDKDRRICVVEVNVPYKVLGQKVSTQFAFELL